MKKRFVIVGIILLIIFGGTFAWFGIRSFFISRFFANFQLPPAAVTTYVVKQQTWSPKLQSVGSVVAVNSVSVTPQVSGRILQFYFQPGQMVKMGDPLIQLDDGLDQQTLRNDQAQLTLTQLTYERYQKLYKQNAVEKEKVDSAQADLVKAQAAVATDQLNIKYKKVSAPFDGKVGIRKVNIGQFVQAGDALVSLQSVTPIFVDFFLPEQYLAKLSQGQEVDVTIDSVPNTVFKGRVVGIDSTVDVNTRNIQVQALFDNPDGKLFPGLFANVSVILPQKQDVLVVPQTAINYSLYGDTIYVVQTDGKDKEGKPKLISVQRFVTTGERQGNFVEVLKGVKAGDEVVVSGQIKLRNNSPIVVNNSIKLNN